MEYVPKELVFLMLQEFKCLSVLSIVCCVAVQIRHNSMLALSGAADFL